MSSNEFKQLVNDTYQKHNGSLTLVVRVVCYSMLLMFSTWLSEISFESIYTTTLCLFTINALVFELLWYMPNPAKLCPHYAEDDKGPPWYKIRLALYIACVFGIGILGLLLTHESSAVSAVCKQVMEQK